MHIEDGPLPDVTAVEERAMRTEIDKWVVSTGKTTHSSHLHLPSADSDSDDARAYCEDNGGNELTSGSGGDANLVEKPTAVYPVGYRDICRMCGHVWRTDDSIQCGDKEGIEA